MSSPQLATIMCEFVQECVFESDFDHALAETKGVVGRGAQLTSRDEKEP